MDILKVVRFVLFTVLVLCFAGNVSAGNNDHKVYKWKPDKIRAYIESTKGQRRIIFIYASWCPYCRQNMPAVMDMAKVKEGSVVAISVDEQHVNFARYLKRFDDIPFKVILNDARSDTLKRSLAKIGVEPWRGIPYVVALDEDNNIVAQGNFEVAKEPVEFVFGGK